MADKEYSVEELDAIVAKCKEYSHKRIAGEITAATRAIETSRQDEIVYKMEYTLKDTIAANRRTKSRFKQHGTTQSVIRVLDRKEDNPRQYVGADMDYLQRQLEKEGMDVERTQTGLKFTPFMDSERGARGVKRKLGLLNEEENDEAPKKPYKT